MEPKLLDFYTSLKITDTETTSIDAKSDILEYGFAMYDPGQEDWVTHSQMFGTDQEIAIESSEKTMIIDEHVEGLPKFQDSEEFIDNYVLGDNMIFVAHNINFDKMIIKNSLDRAGKYNRPNIEADGICTMKLAKKLIPSTSYRQTYLRYLLKLDKVMKNKTLANQPHRVDTDVYVTAYLLMHLVDVAIERDLIDLDKDIAPQLVSLNKQPTFIEKWPLGKHRDSDPRDIPTSYFEWAIMNADFLNEDHENYDADLAHTVTTIMAQRMAEEE